nr:PTS sugar transporter subunit IIA [uncultured Caproiciproducens sp.]
MVNLILAAHGDYAAAILNSAEMIIGEQDHVQTLGLHLGEDVNELRERVNQAITSALKGGEVIVLTDLKCGSPFNVTAAQMGELDFYHITGMNLPLLLEVLDRRGYESAEEICASIVENGKSTIINVNEMLKEV